MSPKRKASKADAMALDGSAGSSSMAYSALLDSTPDGTENTFSSLSEALGFTEEDVEANRDGTITPRQHSRLQAMGRGISSSSRHMVIGVTVFLVIVAAIMLYVFFGNSSMRNEVFGNPVNLMILLVALASPLGILLLAHMRNRKRAAQLAAATQLQTFMGVAHVRKYTTEHGQTVFEVKIGKKKFKFTDDLENLFAEGRTYAFYCVKFGQYEVILSVDDIG